jgi:hypothetical protein
MQTLRRTLFAIVAAVAVQAAMPAFAQSKPNRAETVKYINNVIGKAIGATITHVQWGPMPIAVHSLSYDSDRKTYRTVLEEALVTRVEGFNVRVEMPLERYGWSLRNLTAIDDLPVSVSRNGVSSTSTELRRIRVTFRTGSVRQVQRQHIYRNGNHYKSEKITDENINFVTFYYRASDPDDSKRLRNALLRLKELDDEEKDPFLD